MRKLNKRAEILTENIIFIILNIAFFSILAVFIFLKSNDSSLMEEGYAKKIALVIDAAKPGMEIELNMRSAVAIAKKNDYFGKIISIKGNLVTVKLSQKGGYSYSFFNDVSPSSWWFDSQKGDTYRFIVENQPND